MGRPRRSFAADTRSIRRLIVVMLVAPALALTVSACAPASEWFHQLTGQTADTNVPAPTPSASETLPFNSSFSADGSVALSTDIADGLEVRLDVWAVDPKRTALWTPANDKHFGYAINVYDHHVDEKAVLTQKRQVFISSIQISSQTAQTSGATAQPFQFAADPRTLVPTDTIRSDRGLLLNSYQGGLLVPDTVVHQLPPDTYGLTLSFTFQVSVQQTSGQDGTFASQTIYQSVPIAITPAG